LSIYNRNIWQTITSTYYQDIWLLEVLLWYWILFVDCIYMGLYLERFHVISLLTNPAIICLTYSQNTCFKCWNIICPTITGFHHRFLVVSCNSIFSFMCMFCWSLFVLVYFFFWPLCCLLFFDIRILIAPLISSISSCNTSTMTCKQHKWNKNYSLVWRICGLVKTRTIHSSGVWFSKNKNYSLV
jgi:hypothetical protein